MAITNFASLTGAHKQRDEQIAEQNRPKASWFKIKEGESITVRFMQELDPSSENYNPEFGTFLGVIEHSVPRDIDPNGFMKRALDTMETEGRDLAQELHLKDRKAGWGPQHNFYINLAVETPNGPEVQIFSRKLHSNFVRDLAEIFEDEGTITDRAYVISRRGSGPQTELRIKEAKGKDIDISGLEPWNLEEYAVRHIPYEEQEDYYFRGVDPEVRDRVLGRTPTRSMESSESPVDESDDDYIGDW